MSFQDKKGISLASGFKLQSESPLDVRQCVDTLAERDELVTLNAAPIGVPIYVKENKNYYSYDGENWTIINYTHPTDDGFKHIPVVGNNDNGKILATEDQEALWKSPEELNLSRNNHNHGIEDIVNLESKLDNKANMWKFTNNQSAPYSGSNRAYINFPKSELTPDIKIGDLFWYKSNGYLYQYVADPGSVSSFVVCNVILSSASLMNLFDSGYYNDKLAESFATTNHSHEYSDIENTPVSLPNPNSLIVTVSRDDGKNQITNGINYNGQDQKTVTISNDSIGAAKKYHTHTSDDIQSLDVSKLTGGKIDISLIPKGAIEECIDVDTDEDRFSLTTDQIQKGDTVKVISTGFMYFVKDDTKLDVEEGYEIYTAGGASTAPWSGITGKPTTYPPSQHSHPVSQITDFNDQKLSNPNELTIQILKTIDAGPPSISTIKYDGSEAKTIVISPSCIGASKEIHNHNISDINELETTLDNTKTKVYEEMESYFDNCINPDLGFEDQDQDKYHTTFSIPLTGQYKIGDIVYASLSKQCGTIIDVTSTECICKYIPDLNTLRKFFVRKTDNIVANKLPVPVGTCFTHISPDPTAFVQRFGGTWEVDGNFDTIINGVSKIYYMHRKVSDEEVKS